MKPEASRPCLDIGERPKWHRSQVEGSIQIEYAKKAGFPRDVPDQFEAEFGVADKAVQRSMNVAERFGSSFDDNLDLRSATLSALAESPTSEDIPENVEGLDWMVSLAGLVP